MSATETPAAPPDEGGGLLLELCAPPTPLADELLEEARARGLRARRVAPLAGEPGFGLEPPRAADAARVPSALAALLAPLRAPLLAPTLRPAAPAARPEGRPWRLHLHDDAGLAAARVVVQGASAALSERLAGELRACGLPEVRAQLGAPLRATLRYGGAAPLALATAAWRAARLGLDVTWERAWGAHEQDVWLYAPNPARRGARLRASVPLWLWCDDSARAEPLRAALAARGYDARLAPGAALLAAHPAAQVGACLGPLAEDPDEGERLRAAVAALLEGEGGDAARYPARLLDPDHPLLLALAPHDMHLRVLSAHVLLPSAAARVGALRPRGGGDLARWAVRVCCDDDALAALALRALHAAGFPHAARGAPPSGRALGLEVQWGEARAFPGARRALWAALERLPALDALEPRAEEPEGRWEAPLLDPDEVRVTLCAADLDPARRRARLRAAAAGLEVVLCADEREAAPLARALGDLHPAALEALDAEGWGDLVASLPAPSRALEARAAALQAEPGGGEERGGEGAGPSLGPRGLALACGEVRCGRVPLGVAAWVLREVERCVGRRPALVRDARLPPHELWVLA